MGTTQEEKKKITCIKIYPSDRAILDNLEISPQKLMNSSIQMLKELLDGKTKPGQLRNSKREKS